jgi:hypothetical protein
MTRAYMRRLSLGCHSRGARVLAVFRGSQAGFTGSVQRYGHPSATHKADAVERIAPNATTVFPTPARTDRGCLLDC